MTPTGPGRGSSGSLRFVVLLGVVSLFADMTYEGARAVTGPFLAALGAGATAVGVVAGLGELAGYALRLASGYLSDRTRRHWPFVLLGYGLNVLAVPLLAFAGRWETAAVLMIVERLGKGVRTPPRDVLLSHAAAEMGRGWAFGLHEALDQIGAVTGPLLVAAILYWRASYRLGFGVLVAPALLTLACLLVARALYPEPERFEAAGSAAAGRFPRVFWVYVASVACLGLGFADFALIAFHLKKVSVVTDSWIPVLYALAMAVDGLAALALGKLFDRWGLPLLIGVPVLSCLFAPLAFSRSAAAVVAGTVLWGVGMGAQESVVRAAIAVLVPVERRGTAYGVFNAVYGVAWFAGSALMGALYDVSIPYLAAFSVLSQVLAVPLLGAVRRELRSASRRA